jgi:hypothetical protein
MNSFVPAWRFRILGADEVETEPTQRDQFNNDEVGLADALVREAIQNSTDAPLGSGPVKVRFDFVDLDGADADEVRDWFKTLRPHLQACDINPHFLDVSPIRLLIIEDFNTTGLIGDPAALDNGNFRNFWRVHGRSGKHGKAIGRWGLGKLVYSSASRLHAFFGLTLRTGDGSPLLLGQAVLLNHSVNGDRHPPHGFWFSEQGSGGIQLPISGPEFTSQFQGMIGLERGNNTGLSLVIPFPLDSITEDSLRLGVIQNYYFPILSGKLVVEIGSETIDAQNFMKVAAATAGTTAPFGFVKRVSEALSGEPDAVLSKSLVADGIGEQDFTPETLDELRKRYADGKLVHVRGPVTLNRKDGTPAKSSVDLFLQKPEVSGESFALIVRSALTIPGEKRHFAGSAAYGAMIASDEEVVSFLGDAENPAHTSWNPQAEKVVANWQNPYNSLKAIRSGPRTLYQLLAEQVEQTDADALLDFFSLPDLAPSPKGKKKQTPIPDPLVEPREKALIIRPQTGGFVLTPGPGSSKWIYPKSVRVRAAYDMIGANPFKRFSSFDFDFGKTVKITSDNITIKVAGPNALQLTVEAPEFELKALGFDVNRDLVVEARSIG